MRVHCARHGLKDVIPVMAFDYFHPNWGLEFRISRSKTIQRFTIGSTMTHLAVQVAPKAQPESGDALTRSFRALKRERFSSPIPAF